MLRSYFRISLAEASIGVHFFTACSIKDKDGVYKGCGQYVKSGIGGVTYTKRRK
jgi:hypothetical protein